MLDGRPSERRGFGRRCWVAPKQSSASSTNSLGDATRDAASGGRVVASASPLARSVADLKVAFAPLDDRSCCVAAFTLFEVVPQPSRSRDACSFQAWRPKHAFLRGNSCPSSRSRIYKGSSRNVDFPLSAKRQIFRQGSLRYISRELYFIPHSCRWRKFLATMVHSTIIRYHDGRALTQCMFKLVGVRPLFLAQLAASLKTQQTFMSS